MMLISSSEKEDNFFTFQRMNISLILESGILNEKLTEDYLYLISSIDGFILNIATWKECYLNEKWADSSIKEWERCKSEYIKARKILEKDMYEFWVGLSKYHFEWSVSK